MTEWLAAHMIEIFGAVTGIIYVFLEIKQNIWLWPVGIATSVTYIYVFRDNGFYADMLLQVYYLVISVYGWWAWTHGKQQEEALNSDLRISRIDLKTAVWTSAFTAIIFAVMWYVLDRWTDSPVPVWDAVITTLSVIATWMLTRKILEQWHVWIVANAIAILVYILKGMYPTVILFIVYFVMAIAGLFEWRRVFASYATEKSKTIK